MTIPSVLVALYGAFWIAVMLGMAYVLLWRPDPAPRTPEQRSTERLLLKEGVQRLTFAAPCRWVALVDAPKSGQWDRHCAFSTAADWLDARAQVLRLEPFGTVVRALIPCGPFRLETEPIAPRPSRLRK